MCLTFFEACSHCAQGTNRLWVVQPCKERAPQFAVEAGTRRWVTCSAETQLHRAVKCGPLVPMRTVHRWVCPRCKQSWATIPGTTRCTTTWSDVGKNLDPEELQQLALQVLELRSGTTKMVTNLAEEVGGGLLVDSQQIYARFLQTGCIRVEEARPLDMGGQTLQDHLGHCLEEFEAFIKDDHQIAALDREVLALIFERIRDKKARRSDEADILTHQVLDNMSNGVRGQIRLCNGKG
ncbi:hypothetical protein V8F20_005444 [Naviculisporaceae sp. PSN 640]